MRREEKGDKKNLADIDRKAVKVGYSPCQQCACSHLSTKRENHAHARHVVQSLQLGLILVGRDSAAEGRSHVSCVRLWDEDNEAGLD